MSGQALRTGEAVRIDGVNVASDALADLLTKMDAACENSNTERRADERHPFRRNGLIVRLSHPDVTLVVPSRNLSVSGVSFLYRQMIYPGTPCVVELPLADRNAIRTKGKVASCRHVQGMIHEIGVRFAEPFDEARLAKFYE